MAYVDQIIGKRSQEPPIPHNRYAEPCYVCGGWVKADQGFYFGTTTSKREGRDGTIRTHTRTDVRCQFCTATLIHDQDVAEAQAIIAA